MHNLIHTFSLNLPSQIQFLHEDKRGVEVWCKRDDQIHPIISGNKWRKLIGFVKEFYKSNYNSIVSVGSAHSNYIHSIAYLCSKLSIPLKLYIYGHHNKELTIVLTDLNNWKIEWEQIERIKVQELLNKYNYKSDIFFIPEGGNSECANDGLIELMNELHSDSKDNLLLIASGTGATVKHILHNSFHLDVMTLSPVASMRDQLKLPRLHLLGDALTLPFAAYSDELMKFIHEFYQQHGILLDPIYTSRMMYSFYKSEIKLEKYRKVTFIHSGGLQGWRSFVKRFPNCLDVVGEILIANNVITC
ncbi:MAG: hypothetical protein HOP11_04975 [Saprospiraceae bacterium]|nr:hypothetical protein [Saprospiraceae bacterium]